MFYIFSICRYTSHLNSPQGSSHHRIKRLAADVPRDCACLDQSAIEDVPTEAETAAVEVEPCNRATKKRWG